MGSLRGPRKSVTKAGWQRLTYPAHTTEGHSLQATGGRGVWIWLMGSHPPRVNPLLLIRSISISAFQQASADFFVVAALVKASIWVLS